MEGYMKRMIMFTSFVCLVFIFGCSGAGSPSSVVRKFCAAVEKGDAKAIEQAATPETVQLIAIFGEKAKGIMTANGKIKSTTEEIKGETAVVTVTFENGETENFDLVKIDGKWKVTISK